MDARRAASKQAFEANLPSTPGSQIKAVGSQVAADAAGTVHGLIQMAGSGPFGQLELLKNLPANIVHALVDPASGWIDAIRKGDWNAAASSATKILTQTVPAIAGVKGGVEGVATLAPSADAVMSGAGSARAAVSKLQPGIPTSTGDLAIQAAKTIARPVVNAGASAAEELARWMAKGDRAPVSAPSPVIARRPEVPIANAPQRAQCSGSSSVRARPGRRRTASGLRAPSRNVSSR